jgi:hypothetical protein
VLGVIATTASLLWALREKGKASKSKERRPGFVCTEE